MNAVALWFGRLARWMPAASQDASPPSPPPVPPEIARDKVLLGNQAKRLLDDPVLQLAFQRVADDIAERWKQSKRGDTEAREALYHMQAALQDVRAQLQSFVGNAQVEQKRREAA